MVSGSAWFEGERGGRWSAVGGNGAEERTHYESALHAEQDISYRVFTLYPKTRPLLNFPGNGAACDRIFTLSPHPWEMPDGETADVRNLASGIAFLQRNRANGTQHYPAPRRCDFLFAGCSFFFPWMNTAVHSARRWPSRRHAAVSSSLRGSFATTAP